MGSDTATTTTAAAPATRSLVALLGEQRAAIVACLRHEADASVAELAVHLGISEVATRRHLAVLLDEGFVAADTVNQGRGRPAARYRLTEEGRRLFPHRYDGLAGEVIDFLSERHGRAGLRAFFRWRLEREVHALAGVVTAQDLHDRLHQLAGALSEAGFDASVQCAEHGYTLVQGHCAIEDIAKEHPEICAYEAASFSQVLGRDVTLSRRETLATGAPACVCSVAPRDPAATDAITGTTTETAAKATITTAPHEAGEQT